VNGCCGCLPTRSSRGRHPERPPAKVYVSTPTTTKENAVNKQELVHKVTERTGHNQKQVAEIVAALLDTVQKTLAAGGDIQLTGFGTFKTTDRPAKSAFSALAGRVVDTPARTVPRL
jgi:nucleoid DNA-binding protein